MYARSTSYSCTHLPRDDAAVQFIVRVSPNRCVYDSISVVYRVLMYSTRTTRRFVQQQHLNLSSSLSLLYVCQHMRTGYSSSCDNSHATGSTHGTEIDSMVPVGIAT